MQSVRPFVLPVAGSLALAATAPALRRVVTWLQDHLGERFVPALGGLVAAAGVAVLGAALVRVRQQRLLRYGAVAATLLMVVLPIAISDRGTAREAAVERLHFVLYGGLAILYYRAFERTGHRRWTPALALVAVSLAGLLDEWVQWAVAVRTGEMFDVGLNVYSGLCGVVLSWGLIPLRERSAAPAPRGRRRLAALLVAVVLGGAAFIEGAHLGFAIDDPEIGRFHSQFSRDELLEIDARRLREWRTAPPNRPYRSYELQDHFEIEAGWRVKHRNEAFHGGDARTALKENQLLERYYSAFLALGDMHPPRFQFRLAPEGVERLRREQPPLELERYVSHADGGRIWVDPSRAQLWSAVAAIVVLLLAGGYWPRRRA